MVFFQDWQLWVKMVFVLGIAIVITITAGIIKLIYDHQQLRKFTKIEKEKLEEQPTVEEFARQRRGRQDAAPFGVRAIESGIEVEGVWISKNNSPASSAPASPRLGPDSKAKGKAPSEILPSLQIPEQSHLESHQTHRSSTTPPPPQHHHHRHDKSLSTDSSIGSFERATSAEKLEPVSEASDLIAIPRHGYKPRQPSALRFSTADEFEVGNMSSEYNQHVIIRNGSGSSQASSEGSGSTASQQYHQSSSNHQQISRPTSYQPPNHQRTTRPTSYQPLNHQQTTRPTSYQPSGIQNNHNDNEGGSRSSYLAPGYAQPSRSNRSSYASKGFTYGVVESNQPPSPTPQRFYHSNDSQTKVSEFGDRSLSDARSGRASMLETTELADNSSIDYSGNPPEKAKRISRKLQKKAAT